VNVRFVVLNLRMGGQVASIQALIARLRARGVDADLARPRGLDATDKPALDAYGARPLHERLAGALALLREPVEDVLHLVLPSPSFAAVARLVRHPRLVVQYEGPGLSLGRETLSAAAREPGFILPRLVLNHAAWARLGRRAGATHLATHPLIAAQLRALGFHDVRETPNLTAWLPEDDAPLPPLGAAGDTLVGYAGHAHAVKGVDDLVTAFGIVTKDRPRLRLVLALSTDGDRGRILDRVARAPWHDRVTVLGLVPIRALLARLDALVLPYRSMLSTTLYPSLLLEADAARCPAIVARLPELAPILREGAVTVPPHEPAALAAALAAIGPRDDSRWRPLVGLPPEEQTLDHLVAIYRGMPWN
jgi:glycosyltransferase involved in cell wall biosynthesis